jgi:hypothetical protein
MQLNIFKPKGLLLVFFSLGSALSAFTTLLSVFATELPYCKAPLQANFTSR